MIRTECAVFAAMFLAGAIAWAVAAFLLLLGRGSKVARAVFDLLAPAAIGGVFFFAAQRFALGEIRLYAVAAFGGGILLSRVILRKIAPVGKRLLRKVLLPIKSLVFSLEDKVEAKRKSMAPHAAASREGIRSRES